MAHDHAALDRELNAMIASGKAMEAFEKFYADDCTMQENLDAPRVGKGACRDYEIAFECPEFTCVCPKTGQPDFATIRIRYTPAGRCVELKSLKLYLWSYRDQGAFHEAVTNQILDDLVAAVAPERMTVEGDFYVRGGIRTVVEAQHP